ncbi:S8 family peptidase [Taibaiella soli]|uniref:Fibronectin type-III domain-containing protein n=1 Tax=Taibaiella soli TaxID=1649169 RepID=A0A2W2A729_9BACT|nr:S8 family peptidase [Taibaiella soli]PZF71021.1 hypothetical protein DN068_20170 [Taibaiella soli]
MDMFLHNKRAYIILFFFLFPVFRLLLTDVNAQETNYNIVLKKKTISNPVPNASVWIDSFKQTKPQEASQVLVQFNHLPTAEERNLCLRNGIQLMQYISGNAFIALIQPNVNNAAAQSLRAIIPMDGNWKIDPSVKITPGKKINVTATFLKSISKEDAEKWIVHCNGSVVDYSLWKMNSCKVSVPANKLAELAGWYGVEYISHEVNIVPLNFESRNATKANALTRAVQYGGRGLTGEGVTVGVGDNVSGVYHIDLKDRITNFNPSAYTDHGQHTNGTVGGAGTVDPKGEGFAPHVRLLDHLYDVVLTETPGMHQQYNMTLTNNSYAAIIGNCAYAGTYDALAQFTDQLALDNPEVLHVFAGGNDGYMTCAPYAPGFATVTGGYQPAKNVLDVAGIWKYLNTYTSFSRGPIKDGRLKPEISAVGVSVYSTKGGDAYLSAGGTSMACPNVTGSAALLTERYKQLHTGNPKASLLKCLLMNGATDIDNPGPDYMAGFGIMNVAHSLSMLENNRYAISTVNQGSQNTSTITVPANTAQLKVMLYWPDSAASPIAATQLINDLDLQVTDPSSVTHLPLILDPTPANVNNLAVEGADHLNNVEQVTINNPAAGTYTVNVKGFSVPGGTQEYVLAYDFIQTGLKMMYPVAGDNYYTGDSLRIYWEASNGADPFQLEFSSDNGGTWTTLSSTIDPNARYFSWFTPNISSEQCKFRLTRPGQQDVAGNFVIAPQPVVTLNSVQCPGYISIGWNSVPNATSYEILRKNGFYLQAVDTVTATNYVFSGLSLDSFYYVAVRPLINGGAGWRSKAIRVQPNTGTCAGNISDGDLSVYKITSPGSGRKFTSSQLGANEPITVQLRNLDDVTAANYKLSWKINNNAWQSINMTNPLPANNYTTLSFTNADFSAPGNYTITVAVTNLAMTDPVHGNDTAAFTIRQLNNDTMHLTGNGYLQDFETAGTETVTNDSLGVLDDEHWDFNHLNDTSRLRFAVAPDVSITGNKSASMDLSQVLFTPANNYLTGTFNMGAYDTSKDEVRLEFDYRLSGRPKYQDGNQVWIRSNDQGAWYNVYNYDTIQANSQVVNSGSLSLTSVLAAAHENFTSSMQIRFGQNDTAVISTYNYGNGVTLDNIKLYTVKNDVALLSIIQPKANGCSLTAQEPLSVQVYNNYFQAQSNVHIYYQLDGATPVQETIASIAAKDTIIYNFTHTLDLSAFGSHTLNVWLVANGDTYPANDSIMGTQIRNQPLLSSFPYLENFENGTGYWYAAGTNNSWAFGTPASVKIKKAASGTNAWKTNLTGSYNALERSYLYSPCFDLTNLTNPMLSFSMAYDLENCGSAICDVAYVEYAINDTNWTRLGAYGQGTNWYDSNQVWNEQDMTRWHVASIPLPTSLQTVRFRFVLNSDQGSQREGLAIDDIHIFDLAYPVYQGDNSGTVTQTASAGQWTNFIKNGQLLAQINAVQSLGQTDVSAYMHDQFYDTSSAQYYLPENFVVNVATQPTDSVTARFYVSDSDVVRMVGGTGCSECNIPQDAYSLGVTRYHSDSKNLENGSLTDNVNGTYSFTPYAQIKWVPYDKGYYAELKVPSFSEFWFNDGMPGLQSPLGISNIVFDARKASTTTALATWSASIDASVDHYVLQRSTDGSSYTDIYTVGSQHSTSQTYNYVDTPNVALGGTVYYRVHYYMQSGDDYYTYFRKIVWTEANQLISLFPNPIVDGTITVVWSANPCTAMDVNVFDLLGRKAREFHVPATDWNNVSKLNMTGFGTGIYIFHIAIGDNKYNQRVLVH